MHALQLEAARDAMA